MSIHGDISDPRILWIKGALFVLLGLLALLVALVLCPDLRLAVLMAIAIWAFCRAYYFAFYVIEHYADPTFRYAGLTSLLRYVIQHRNKTL